MGVVKKREDNYVKVLDSEANCNKRLISEMHCIKKQTHSINLHKSTFGIIYLPIKISFKIKFQS